MIDKLLNVLKLISKLIAENDDYNVIFPKIVTLLAGVLNVDVCSIYIYNKKNKKLILSATHGLNVSDSNQVEMKVGNGLTGHSFKKRKTLNINSPSKHPKYKHFEDIGEEEYNSYVSVPLIISNKCLGIIVLQRVSNNKFDSSTVDMLTSLSTQLANIILNANMLKELETQQLKRPELSKETTILRGISANAGIATGVALLYTPNNYLEEITHSETTDKEKSLNLFEQAVKLTKQKTLELENKALSMITEADAAIFNVHLMFLEDHVLLNDIRNEISKNGHSVEFSIKVIYKKYQKKFAALDSPMFRERAMDLKDIMLRLVETVIACTDNEDLLNNINKERKYVLVAQELLPSDLLRMPIENITGIVCEKGGLTAHIAILAKALGIPALLGVKDASKILTSKDELLLDCYAGLAHINPTDEIIKQFKDKKVDENKEITVDKTPCHTKDGTRIPVKGNVSLTSELDLLAKFGAEGIGLYRTEFMYMIRDHLPSEDAQYNVYSKIIKASPNNETTIRVLDIGGDKPLPYMHIEPEENPALGNRGIRLLLNNETIFKSHIRAILRAGVFGKIILLIPMISGTTDIIKVKEIIEIVKCELREEEIGFSENYQLAVMLEVPSAVMDLDNLIKEVDYMSIGSNDLLQYFFAMDRGTAEIAGEYTYLSPIFLGVLKHIGSKFENYPEKTLAICGEMAGDLKAIPFLLACGINELSMAPKFIPKAKEFIKSISIDESKELLKTAMQLKSSKDIEKLVI